MAPAPRTRMYRNGNLEDENFALDQISEHLAQPDAVIWVDMCAPDITDLQLVADELGLHALAVEDAVSERQRPKMANYGSHDFLSAYAVYLDVETGELHSKEIAAFITSSALI